MRDIFLGEMIGTMILIILGNGVVANVNMNKSGMQGGGSVQITIAWGLAVLLPATIFGALTGAHFNPALTIALAFKGDVAANLVPTYIGSQILGAFLGQLIVFLLFKDHFDATADDPALVRGSFCTAPSIPNTGRNLLSEIVGTFVLVFAILGFGNVAGAADTGVDKLFVYGLIVSIGMSTGGLTGYAINPARDLGPRIAYAVLPVKNKIDANWGYGWIPVVGPIIGGIIAVILFNFIF
ncbi:MIP/aquaporin family protein [uncultured Anaerococcus sp.]|uniref:MIP/aquaporin family protein n=1 Tax=uncultured Anaerococcus sp. TaxID=293428 RepID=UPI0025FC4024|nr:MIP/aquaporin family protein [uncultured Anaerococcus sp.]